MPPWLALHVVAGCDALFGCSVLAAHAAELSAATAFKLAAACALVFGPGAALLEAQLQAVVPGAGAAAAAVLLLQDGCRAQPSAVMAVMQMLRQPHRLKVAVAFAGSTGKPAALLPWLHALSRVMVAAGAADPEVEPGERPLSAVQRGLRAQRATHCPARLTIVASADKWQGMNAHYLMLLANVLAGGP